MKLKLQYSSSVDLTRPDLQKEIQQHILDCLRDFPDICEGSIVLDGVEHFFTYMTRIEGSDQIVEVNILLRDVAEKVLNEGGLSTHEPTETRH
jgi:hypothetical protein